MTMHPLNLALRFGLEMAALGLFAVWGWRHGGDGLARLIMAVMPPLAGAALWAIFAVPDDPSRNGAAPVAVPGLIRLALEAGIFVAAALALADIGGRGWAIAFAAVTAAHYALSWQRLAFLLDQSS